MSIKDLNNKLKTLTEEEYTYIQNNDKDIEILILEIEDSSNKLRDFQKDYIALRCFVDGNKMYFWDCDVLHETVASKLGIQDEITKRFLIDRNDIDGYYIHTFEDMLYELELEEVVEIALKYRANIRKLEKLGLHLSKESEELLNKICNKEISMNEKLEELETGIYATQSAYDILNWMKNKPNSYRIVYDKNIRTYFICDAYNWIHQDMLEAAYRSGFYPDMFSQGEVRDYLDNEVYNGTLLFFAFSPKSDKQLDVEKSSDGYTQKYEYDFGTIYAHELTSIEDFDIYQLLGTPNKKEFIYESIEQLNIGIKRLLS